MRRTIEIVGTNVPVDLDRLSFIAVGVAQIVRDSLSGSEGIHPTIVEELDGDIENVVPPFVTGKIEYTRKLDFVGILCDICCTNARITCRIQNGVDTAALRSG